MILLWKLIIIATALAGFFVSRHIGKKKNEQRPFTCPLKFECHTVVTSNYSSLFGVGLEKWGMAYYSIIALSYATFIVLPELSTPTVGHFVMVLSIGAFVFSLFLTYVQAVKLKQWCSWCLVSAGFSVIIFLSVIALWFAMLSF